MGQARRKKLLGVKSKRQRFMELALFICDKKKYSEKQIQRFADIRKL